jgi:hypothetical protein
VAVNFQERQEILHSLERLLVSIQSLMKWVPRFLSSGLKRPGREAYHTLAHAEVKNGGAVRSLLLGLHGTVLN